MPTYGYELDQAVKDGFLIDFKSVETSLKFLTKGITYDELSPEEKKSTKRLLLTRTVIFPSP